MPTPRLPWILAASAAASGLIAQAGSTTCPVPAQEPVDFQREVLPILSDRCFPCHGPDAAQRKAGLRLDTRAGATRERAGIAAVVPGDPEASEMIFRLRAGDPDDGMPPPESGLSIEASEIRVLERWIASGARYDEHWAFVPPERAEAPAVADPDWARDPLDRFVQAAFEARGFEPAPEADRSTWLRRASMVLTGIPPSIRELDQFLADEGPRAYEEQVERLLRSSRHAERMAVDWLDLARYADTFGYQADVEMKVWPWRDWVIDAFRNNLPYDRFLVQQLAGDLLPGATRGQKLATTFNRLHRQTNEGGSVEEEFRVEYVADRVQTFGTAVLGVTLECARCHDHKFDPISQREFYELSAFFDRIDESGLYSHYTPAVPTPALDLPTEEQRKELRRLEEALRAIGPDELPVALDPDAMGELPRRAGLVGSFSMEGLEGGTVTNAADPDKPGKPHDAPGFVPGRDGKAVLLSGDDNLHFPGIGAWRRWDPWTFAMWLKIPEPYERAVLLHFSKSWTDAASQGYQLLIEDGRLSSSVIHFWPGNAIRVRTVAPLPVGTWMHLAASYDGSSKAAGLKIYLNGEAAQVEVVRDGLTRTIRQAGAVTLTLGERDRDKGLANGLVDELMIFDRVLAPLEIEDLAGPGALERTIRAARAGSEDAVRALGRWRAAQPTGSAAETRAERRTARRALGEHVDAIPAIMTMKAAETGRATHVLHRGSYRDRRERVAAGLPAALSDGEDDASDRLDLARWVTRPDHPLTARVAVNRLWAQVFGRGLVDTPDNFGRQGARPSHPALLDRLAVDFVDSGWDQRATLRRLVLSATFRQSSRPTASELERDPGNRWLARGPRVRLPAEMIRDQLLAVSGLLVERVGGPSVRPYQPPGIWKEVSGRSYQPSQGEDLYRRSLYTFWKRTAPPPSMMIFDAARREVCVAKRSRTNTPLQTLVLWNDPQYTEAARRLARDTLLDAGLGEDDARLTRIFRLLTSHPPDDVELGVLRGLLAGHRSSLRGRPGDARALLGVGASPPAGSLEPVEHAAWTLLCSDLFAYDPVRTLR